MHWGISTWANMKKSFPPWIYFEAWWLNLQWVMDLRIQIFWQDCESHSSTKVPKTHPPHSILCKRCGWFQIIQFKQPIHCTEEFQHGQIWRNLFLHGFILNRDNWMNLRDMDLGILIFLCHFVLDFYDENKSDFLAQDEIELCASFLVK